MEGCGILITGAGGQTGRELAILAERRQMPVAAIERKDLDITSMADVSGKIASLGPDVVINAAAYTAVDRAEDEPEKAFSVNRDGAENLAACCEKAGIPLIHLSTDYVFDGEKKGKYVEGDRVNPQGVYATSKWEGEESVRRILDRHIIVRLSWVFGRYGSNFVHTMLKIGKGRKELKVVADQHGCPTSTIHIAEMLLSLSGRIAGPGENVEWGTYHYCDGPVTSWYEFARVIFSMACSRGIIQDSPVIIPIPGSEYGSPVKRPANSALDCSKIERNFNVRPGDWRDGLALFLDAM
jgi:dTDP-4-dehydrorhamnose reductase